MEKNLFDSIFFNLKLETSKSVCFSFLPLSLYLYPIWHYQRNFNLNIFTMRPDQLWKKKILTRIPKSKLSTSVGMHAWNAYGFDTVSTQCSFSFPLTINFHVFQFVVSNQTFLIYSNFNRFIHNTRKMYTSLNFQQTKIKILWLSSWEIPIHAFDINKMKKKKIMSFLILILILI